MRLTPPELTAASSAVAALAIVGGYLGVRSANRTAVAIAREERSVRLTSNLDALKRVAYSEFLVALSKLADDQMAFDVSARYAKEESEKLRRRSVSSARTANDKLAQLALVASQPIRTIAEEAFRRALSATEDDISAVAADAEELLAVMRTDLGT
jgi:hypothetical protein